MRTLVDYLTSMSKYCIDAVIVVEGKTDVSYLSSFIDSYFFTTNGYDINKGKLDFLKRVSKVNKIIVLTDNDKAGIEIENKIKNEIPEVFTIKTSKITRKNYKKSGVAETDKAEIIKALDQFVSSPSQKEIQESYNLTEIISLSENPRAKRNEIINEYRLIKGNNKYLEDQLSMLKIDAKEFKEKYGN